MKVVFLSTESGETHKYAESLQSCMPCELTWMHYADPNATENGLYAKVKETAPDLIVYIGSRWGPQPSIATLARITDKVAPMVHLCSDAADLPWHDLLRDYDRAGAFSLQVAIDGNPRWPGAEHGLTLLTPIAASHFPPSKPHAERRIHCSYAGNKGSEGGQRRRILTELMFENLLNVRVREEGPDSYDGYCRHLADSRMTLDVPLSGTEQAMQVKGRVIEAGLAGACLLELGGSPIITWFRPSIDYLEYATIEDAKAIIRRMARDPAATQAIGESLRARVLEEHSPRIFWGRILERIGLPKMQAVA